MAPRCPRCNTPLKLAVHLTGLYRCPRIHDGRVAFWREARGELVRADAEADKLARHARQAARRASRPTSSFKSSP